MIYFRTRSAYFLNKGIFLVAIFLILLISQTESVKASFPQTSPLFTRSHDLTKPATNSEPINLNWNGYTAQQIADFYASRGWQMVTSNAWQNINVKFNFNPFNGPIGAYVIVENSGSVWIDESSIGGPSKVNNWNNITFVKNSNDIAILSSTCFVNLAMPITRDHFRIWQFGNNVIGSATHDSGFESTTATYFEQLANYFYTLFCGATVAMLMANIFSLGTLTTVLALQLASALVVPIIHYLIINPIASSTGGHLIASYPHGWSSASVVAQSWSSNNDHVVDQYRDSGISPTWKLTGRTQKWNYLGYNMNSYNGSNSLTITNSNSNIKITSLKFTLNDFIIVFQIPFISWFVIKRRKRKFIKI